MIKLKKFFNMSKINNSSYLENLENTGDPENLNKKSIIWNLKNFFREKVNFILNRKKEKKPTEREKQIDFSENKIKESEEKISKYENEIFNEEFETFKKIKLLKILILFVMFLILKLLRILLTFIMIIEEYLIFLIVKNELLN